MAVNVPRPANNIIRNHFKIFWRGFLSLSGSQVLDHSCRRFWTLLHLTTQLLASNPIRLTITTMIKISLILRSPSARIKESPNSLMLHLRPFVVRVMFRRVYGIILSILCLPPLLENTEVALQNWFVCKEFKAISISCQARP
jgi:hypothetical protein